MSEQAIERLAGAEPVSTVRKVLAREGVEAWLVGGTIRDALLGRPLHDLDLALDGDAAGAAGALADAVRGPAFKLSESFGAWRVLDRRHGVTFDLTPLQGERIEADLAQRELTMNAMALPLGGGELLDPFEGRAAVKAKELRLVDEEALRRDGLRTLRLARFMAELGFTVDPAAEGAAARHAVRVTDAAPERVWSELRQVVTAEGVLDGLAFAERTGVLAQVLPELTDLHSIEQSHYHHLDVYDHTVEVLARLLDLERDLGTVFGEHAGRVGEILAEPLSDELTRGQALRFAALLHDVGKPATRGVRPDGRVTFIGHDARGEEMIRGACRRLRASERLAAFLGALARHHLVLGFLVHRRPLSLRDVYRYLRAVDPVEVEVTLLTCADRLATRGRNAEPAIAAHLELARELMGAALDWRTEGPPRSPLRGDELAREVGIRPGPELGALLGELEEAIYAGEASTREETVELARRLRHSRTP
ncbi:MAG: HD domain-containing protein [Actinomycetota bacterium]|nr:HD domain-containing protein [Actinomycetota bacterium]MDQ3719784.1 HD domain-containing protein [Actinomycetota bacterium]